jgi:hypothetical protein
MDPSVPASKGDTQMVQNVSGRKNNDPMFRLKDVGATNELSCA